MNSLSMAVRLTLHPQRILLRINAGATMLSARFSRRAKYWLAFLVALSAITLLVHVLFVENSTSIRPSRMRYFSSLLVNESAITARQGAGNVRGFNSDNSYWQRRISRLNYLSPYFVVTESPPKRPLITVDTHLKKSSSKNIPDRKGQVKSPLKSVWSSVGNKKSPDMMINLTIDNPNPKTIGKGKEQLKPLLKRVKQFDYNIVLFTAVAGNTSSANTWDTITIQGWEYKKLINYTYNCCVKYTSGEVRSVPATKLRWSYTVVSEMSATQFVCPNLTSRSGELPEMATLTGRKMQCHDLYNWYLPLTFAHAHKNEIAVCSKFAYLNLAADDLLGWFEVHRRLGVSKVLLYTHDLNPQATRVLEYYQALGVANVIPFNFLYKDPSRGHTAIGVKNHQAWNDEQVPVFDCLARLRGYRYLVLIDTDEYLMSTRGLPWMNMLDDLFAKYPKAAGHTFLVKVHVTSWNKTSARSKFKVGQYINSTRPIADRMKHVTMPERLAPGGLSTHHFNPNWSAGFNRNQASADDAVIHHFRSCRDEWLRGNQTCFRFERSPDDTVSKIFEQIEPDVLKLKAKIFDSQ